MYLKLICTCTSIGGILSTGCMHTYMCTLNQRDLVFTCEYRPFLQKPYTMLYIVHWLKMRRVLRPETMRERAERGVGREGGREGGRDCMFFLTRICSKYTHLEYACTVHSQAPQRSWWGLVLAKIRPTLGDCLTSRPEGCSRRRELWFLIYSCTFTWVVMSTVRHILKPVCMVCVSLLGGGVWSAVCIVTPFHTVYCTWSHPYS